MNTITENKIIELMTELEKVLKNEPEKFVEYANYKAIKKMQDSINYKLNELVQCDDEEPEE